MPDKFKKKHPLSDKNKDKNSGQKPDGDFDWSRIIRAVFSWGAVIILAVIALQLFNSGPGEYPEIDYKTYEKLLLDDKIISGECVKQEMNDYIFKGELKAEERIVKNTKTLAFKKFTVSLVEPIIEKEKARWDERQISYKFSKESSEWLTLFFGNILWILMFVGIWILFMRRMQGGGGGGGGSRGIFNFGKSKAKMISETQGKVTFKDVAGADEAKQELEEIIEFLKEPSKFQRLGGKIPRGVLLLGPPGTGKTLLARAVAGEAGVPFFSISGADFVEMFVGVGASRVRDLFEQGKKNAPCIIFIDEIDAVGRHRGAGLGGGHDEREQTLNQLLVEMDGFEQNSGVILIAATNRPDVLDPALLRPGRFDRQVVVDRPDVKGREGILKVHTRKTPLDTDVKIKTIAKGTPGLSGADLANLVNEAALLAARKNKKKVSMLDFEEAKDKVMMGTERKSLIISDKEKKLTAYHEIGHVMVAKMLQDADPVHKVTIIPRGRALGVTMQLPLDDKHSYSKKYLLAQIKILLGGRKAEELFLDDITNGASSDIDRASSIARKMVCEWGMSDAMGPLAYGQNEEEIFLGREVTKHKEYSDETARNIDNEIRGIIDSCFKEVERILNENADAVHKLSAELLERELLDAEEIDLVMKGEKLPPLKNGNGSDEIPEHVKQLMEDKIGRTSSEEEDSDKKGNEKKEDDE